MPANKNMKQTGKPVRKAPGMRAGILEDWREASKSGKTSGGSGKTLRDGR